ncbi:uncharacterized protein LOC105698268 [Orussus abietinus]|uniref:uncharacterized protein LOC105698268 n=1 Tax=Orussus abietinus TaxID=222816 RepID=UPI0006253E09|nr:uncharacterized protein LOC105698268 [Orussus abietinus]
MKEAASKGSGREVKRYRGDGLRLEVDSNEQILEIAGDGCRIRVAENLGSLRVSGDGCSLRVVQNSGDIEYVGDGGRVVLGHGSSKARVKYVGQGGEVRCERDTGGLPRRPEASDPGKVRKETGRGDRRGARTPEKGHQTKCTTKTWTTLGTSSSAEVTVRTYVPDGVKNTWTLRNSS